MHGCSGQHGHARAVSAISRSASLAGADPAELEALIRSTGFFRAKARNLLAMASQVVDRHDGEIPRDLDELTALAGVGRKTANVVLGTAFGIAKGIVVDTHVKRLARRLGLTSKNTPEQIERELMALVPRPQWVEFSHRLIHHGRRVCLARRPRCEVCTLASICPKVGVATAGGPVRRRLRRQGRLHPPDQRRGRGDPRGLTLAPAGRSYGRSLRISSDATASP